MKMMLFQYEVFELSWVYDIIFCALERFEVIWLNELYHIYAFMYLMHIVWDENFIGRAKDEWFEHALVSCIYMNMKLMNRYDLATSIDKMYDIMNWANEF